MSRSTAIEPALPSLVLVLGALPFLAGLSVPGPRPAGAPEDPEMRALVRGARSVSAETRHAAWARVAEYATIPDELRGPLQRTAGELAREAGERLRGGSILRDLETLGEQRVELDHCRRMALALILDEERYFFPHTPPDVTAERARGYPAVQAEVEKRTAAVRAVWEAPAEVEVGERVRIAARDLCALAPLRDRLEFEWPEGVPRWALGIADAANPIHVQNFAWTPQQAEALAYDLRVEQHNEALWAELDALAEASSGAGPDPGFPRSIERDQVRLTNAYRRMLGVPALTWSASLQRAARGHSAYMAAARVLTHDQPPGRFATPRARMRNAGYPSGRAENIFYGAGGALAAHHMWLGSSAHHRNLVQPDLRSMASAEDRGFWTQNLGTRASFHEREPPELDDGKTDR